MFVIFLDLLAGVQVVILHVINAKGEKNDTPSNEKIESQSKKNDPDNVPDKVKQILKK